MFARPNTKINQPKKPSAQLPKKQSIFSNAKIKQIKTTSSKYQTNPTNEKYKKTSITKIASIRTLPPFLMQTSQKGTTSKQISAQLSECQSQIWKQQCQLFQSQDKQHLIKIDQYLRDTLQTIRKQRNMIDLKIQKLRMKILQSQRKTINSVFQSKQVSISTDFDDEKCLKQLKNRQVNSYGTQFPQQHSAYFKMNLIEAKLCSPTDLDLNDYQQIQKQTDPQTKIRQNKEILNLLLNQLALK